jgi:hypothetical protein
MNDWFTGWNQIPAFGFVYERITIIDNWIVVRDLMFYNFEKLILIRTACLNP